MHSRLAICRSGTDDGVIVFHAMRSLARRLRKLEETVAPKRSKLWVVAYEGPSTEGYPQPTAEEFEQASRIWVVRIVATREDRQLESGALPAYR
jgi:hypothetical protein